MAFEHKAESGSLFRNDRKETDNHPDYTGSCKIDGVEYWISGWKNQARGGGKTYLGLKFRKKDAPKTESRDSASDDDWDDDIPF